MDRWKRCYKECQTCRDQFMSYWMEPSVCLACKIAERIAKVLKK